MQNRHRAEPLVEFVPQVGHGPGQLPALQIFADVMATTAQRGHVHRRGPRLVRIEADGEGKPLFVDLGWLGRRDDRLPGEGAAFVAQPQSPLLDQRVGPALLRAYVLDLEYVGEVAAHLQPDRDFGRAIAVVEYGQLLVEAAPDRALANDGDLGVDVVGRCAGDHEEPRLEVLQVVH